MKVNGDIIQRQLGVVDDVPGLLNEGDDQGAGSREQRHSAKRVVGRAAALPLSARRPCS